jgi:hypothetical protein
MVPEAHGALSAAKFSQDLGLQSIVLEGDSLQVVKALVPKYGQVLDDTKGVLNLLRN